MLNPTPQPRISLPTPETMDAAPLRFGASIPVPA